MKIKPKFETKTVHLLDFFELRDICQQVYGLPVELAESSNDTAYYIDKIDYQHDSVHRTTTLHDIQQRVMLIKPSTGERVRMDLTPWNFELVIQDLINMEILPAGNYVIEVCW